MIHAFLNIPTRFFCAQKSGWNIKKSVNNMDTDETKTKPTCDADIEIDENDLT